MKSALTLLALSLTLLLGFAPTAHAGFIVQPVGVSTDMGSTTFGTPVNVRNQSGLSAAYTSLMTNFDSYIASNPTHNSNLIHNLWVSVDLMTTGNFDFDLGGTFVIESFALWNAGANFITNVRGFELLAADNAAFLSPTSLGTFDGNPNTGPFGAVLPEVFTFAPTSAAFVRLRITSNNGAPVNTSFGEAAFEVRATPAAVPEPASLTLLGLGSMVVMAGVVWRRRRGLA